MDTFLKNIVLVLLITGIVTTITLTALVYLETTNSREFSQANQTVRMSGGGD
jgi:hypothetical protein